MSNSEETVYEIIASLPVDYNRVELLRDITFEAQLLIRSRFVRKITLKYDDFKKLHEYSNSKDVLLITEISGNRFIVYIERGVIVSTAMSNPTRGERIVGLKPLATLITISKQQPVIMKLFEILEKTEDRTLETISKPQPLALDNTIATAQKQIVREEAVTKPVEEKPLIVMFAERLREFKNRVEKILYEVTPMYGCKLVEYKISIARETIVLNIVLKKKSVITKCRVDELRSLLKNDLELILTMLDINLPLDLNIDFKE